MIKLLKKDSFILGISLGLIIPMIFFAILYNAFGLLKSYYMANILKGSLMLASIFLNMFALRYYLLNQKFDKTGRGILLATFVYAIAYFWIFFND